jgi:t-SNARE complex subunit (syntaxin)
MRQRKSKTLVYAIVITAIILAMLLAFVRPGLF